MDDSTPSNDVTDTRWTRRGGNGDDPGVGGHNGPPGPSRGASHGAPTPPPMPPGTSTSPWDLAPPVPPPPPDRTATTRPEPLVVTPAPAAQPVLSETYGDTGIPYMPARRRRPDAGRLAWIAAVVGALALLVGGGYLALTAFGADGGAESPEAAVDEMLAALNAEDFLAFGELVEPGERRTLIEPTITEILPELVRLGVFDEQIDMGDLSGIDLELTDVTYRIDEVDGAPDLRHVHFTGGTATSSMTAADLPLGDAILSRFGEEMQDEPTTTQPIEEAEPPVVLVERNERWYVSGWFTVGEAARLATDQRMPAIAEQPFPLGSDSPEEAAEQFIREIADFDLEGLIGRMDPEEAAALYRYAPLFLDDAQIALDDAEEALRSEDIRWSVRNFDFDVDQDGDDAIAHLRGFSVEVSTPDLTIVFDYSRTRIELSVDGLVDGERVSGSLVMTPDRWTLEGTAGGESIDAELSIDRAARSVRLSGSANGEPFNGEFQVDPDARCSEYRFNGFDNDERGCLEDLVDEMGGDAVGLVGEVGAAFDEFPAEFGALPIATHRTDGRWYVSPTGTVMHGVITGLQDLDQDDFDSFLDDIEAGRTGLLQFDEIVAEQLDAMSTLSGDGLFGGGSISTDGPVLVPDEPSRPEASEFRITPIVGEATSYRDVLESGGDRHEYLVDVQSGQTIGVTVYGSSVIPGGVGDPILEVRDPNGVEVAFSDDYDGLDSGLQYTAASTGTHRLVVQDLQFSGGEYELTIQIVQPGASPSVADGSSIDAFDPLPPVVPTDIEPATVEVIELTAATPTVVEDVVELGSYDVWGFEPVQVGQRIVVTVEAGSSPLDAEIFLIDGRTLEELAQNDDAAPEWGLGPLDSRIEIVAQSSATHYVEVHSFGDLGEGAYTLTIEVG